MKRNWIVSLMVIMMGILLIACSNNEDEMKEEVDVQTDEVEVENNEDALEGSVDVSTLSGEELVTYFFDAINENDVEMIYDNVYDGQLDSIKNGIAEIQESMQANEILIEVEEVLGTVEFEEYVLFIFLNKFLDQDGNVLNYMTGQIPFMNVDGQLQYVWDFTLLPEHIAQQEALVQQQINELMESEKVTARLMWAEEQNRIHQEAFQQHLQAHQQAMEQHHRAVEQHNQMMEQHHQQQMHNQMMAPPPPGF